MSNVTYELSLYTPGGSLLGPLHTVESCIYARTLNDAGEMTLTFPADVYDPSWFAPFSRILIYRSAYGMSPYIDLDTPWFIVDGPTYTLDDSGREMVTVECQDALGLILGSRIVAYNDNNEYTYKLDEADDMMKAVIRENYGSLALDTDRNISGFLSVSPDVAAAPIIRFGSFSRQKVLDVLKDIADASMQDDTPTWLGFDIVQANAITGLLEFRTYINQRGNNHRFPGGSPPLLLSPEAGNLTDIEADISFRDAASIVYAGGAGFGDIRPIVEVENTEMLALSQLARKEIFVDGSQILEVDSLTAFAKSELEKAKPKRTITAKLIESDSSLRGVHWDYGDALTAYYKSLTYDAHVEKIAVRLEAGKGGGLIETSEVQITGEANV